MLTGVRLAPLVSVSPTAWASSAPPAELGGSLFVLSLGPRRECQGQVPGQPPDPGLAEKLLTDPRMSEGLIIKH